MFICICNALTEKQVDEAIDSGASCSDRVYSHHGCAPQCGKCVCEVKDRIRTRKSHRVATSPGISLPIAAS